MFSSLARKLTLPKCDITVAVFGLVRIAKKYQFDQLTSVIIDHVANMWPKTLHEWDLQESTFRLLQNSSHVTATQLRHAVSEPASAIMFALEFDVPTILPAAFYMLAVTPSGADWASTLPTKSTLYSAARWDLLDGPTAIKLLRGRDSLRAHLPKIPLFNSIGHRSVFAAFGDSNVAGTTCDSAKKEALNGITGGAEFLSGHPHHLRILQDVSIQLAGNPGICSNCILDLDQRVTEARSALWAHLPKAFGIAGLQMDSRGKKRKTRES